MATMDDDAIAGAFVVQVPPFYANAKSEVIEEILARALETRKSSPID
ncbi:hypothetical protein [Nocardia tengchongensis]